MTISIGDIKKLRDQTGAGIADCRAALEEVKGNLKKAADILKSKGIEDAAKKADREVKAGLVDTYIHAGGKVGSMVEIACETDFVARTDEFKALSHEVAMQIAAMNPKNIDELLGQDYIRDNSKKINDLVKETIAKLGENIIIRRIIRFDLGGE